MDVALQRRPVSTRSGRSRLTALSSILATFSHELCLGVWWISSRSATAWPPRARTPMLPHPLNRAYIEDVNYQHCHATADDLIRRVAAFEDGVNASPYLLAHHLWVKDQLDPGEEKLRFSK